MATVAINLYSDLQQPVKVQYIDGNMFSMDNAGNTVNVYVNDGGEPATLSGDVSALVIRPDGATVAVPGALDGNRAYVIMPQAVYAVPGVVSVVVKLTINTTVTTIAAFVANVYQSSTDTVVDPGTIIPSVQNLISAINAAVASIPADYSALWATLAPAYSSKTYAVGDYCTNGGVLYRCIVPITAAESWTAAHWAAANIGNDLSALKSAIDLVDDNLFTASEMTPNTTASGWRLNESNGLSSSNSSYKLVKYIVSAGNVVKVESDDRFQFQTVASVPASGSNNRVGDTTYQNGEFVLTVPQGANYLIVSTLVSGSTAKVYDLKNNTEKNAEDIAALDTKIKVANIAEDVEISYPDGSHSYATAYRSLWPDAIPKGSYIESVSVPTGNIGANPSLTIEVWEVGSDGNTMTLAFDKTVTPLANNNQIVEIGYYTKAKALIARRYANVQLFYRSNQTGDSYYTSTDTTAEDELLISSLTKYTNMSLVGGFKYIKAEQYNKDFFSGYLAGNIIVFGDSTVDGSSTTGHTDNVIGTDRTASSEPNVYTSIMEGMIRTFNGNSSFRVYNGGFGGKTLNYIADNYTAIMAAFSNVKSALLVIDANSASQTRADYETRTRSGLERMIALLQNDGIAVAVASPQPMFYYPADDGTLPAVNSAGEFAIAVNIGKDICEKYGIPFINLGGITNRVMESPYLKASNFYGDRIHFGDGGHKFEAYELYGELIHPIIYFDGKKTYIPLESNKCELSASSGISASTIDGYRSIVLQNTHTRTDVLVRFYIISEVPFKVGGIDMSFAYNADTYVDGVLYQEGVSTFGATIQAGTHEVTIKPEAGKIVRFSGLMIESAE